LTRNFHSAVTDAAVEIFVIPDASTPPERSACEGESLPMPQDLVAAPAPVLRGSPPAQEDVLLELQALEQTLLRARLARPQWLAEGDYQLLRYALRLAALDRFEPGAAQGRRGRGDVQVDPTLLQPFRALLLLSLATALRRDTAMREALPRLGRAAQKLRKRLLLRHGGDFSAAELDAEIAHKKLVLVAGGGGGAGYVYLGALARLMAEGIAPDYIVGSSIGALLGGFIARQRRPDYAALLDLAKRLNFADIFGAPRAVSRHSLPGVMRLHLRGLIEVFAHASGDPLQLHQLEIPYEAVVAGVHARIGERRLGLLPAPQSAGRSRRHADRLAGRAWQLTTLLTPNLIDEIVLGRDELTRQFDVIEAVGFSAAIPGVLHYDPWRRSERMRGLLAQLCRERRLAAIVDGGVANNVPAKTAWRGVRSGRIGTRNAWYLAFDSFMPQTHRKHILLWPVTQAVQLQMPANRPYFDWLLQFRPTLSPANLLPSPSDFDRAWGWGWQQMEEILPMVQAALAPVELAALPWNSSHQSS